MLGSVYAWLKSLSRGTPAEGAARTNRPDGWGRPFGCPPARGLVDPGGCSRVDAQLTGGLLARLSKVSFGNMEYRMNDASPWSGATVRTAAAVALGAAALVAGCARNALAPPPDAAPQAETAPPVTVEPHSEWAEATLYFAIVDRFADGDPTNNDRVDREAKGAFHGGDLAGLRQQLDEIAELGTTALWITPVVKQIDGFVTGAGFPDWGYHGYWADDFYALDPRFGSEEDLKALVEDCHRRGIAVLLDVVYNHAGYGSRYTTDPATRGWLRVEGRGECGSDDITGCVAGLPDFKTELPEVRDYLIEAAVALAERVGLDGFRLDTVKHVSHEFWQEHPKRTRERLGEDFFLLGEVWGGDAQNLDPWFEGDEMDAGFDFGFQGSVLAFVQGRGRAIAFDRYLERRRQPREGYLLSHYLSSHDVPGGLFQLGGDQELFRLAALLQMTSNGVPMIYYGEEVGRPGGDWPANRSDMPWGERAIEPGAGDPRDEGLRAFYRRLIEIRRARPALWRGSHRGLAFEQDLYVFARRDPQAAPAAANTVVVAVNRGAEEGAVAFEPPEGWAGATVRDLLTDETFAIDPQTGISVPPRSGRILVVDSQ